MRESVSATISLHLVRRRRLGDVGFPLLVQLEEGKCGASAGTQVTFDRSEHFAPPRLVQQLSEEHWGKDDVERGVDDKRSGIGDVHFDCQATLLCSSAQFSSQLRVEVQSGDAALAARKRETHSPRPAADLQYVTRLAGRFARRGGEPAPERDVSFVGTALEVVPDRLET
jgi:hypothetical protein